MRPRLPVILACSVLLAGCSDSTGPAALGSIKLSAAQVAVVKSRMIQITNLQPELGWLADSIDIVLQTGIEVDSVGVATDLGPGPYYAIGLHRAFSTSGNGWATFNVILFDNPSKPTSFIIIDGWSQGSVKAPPRSVSGSLGAPGSSSTVNAYLFHIAGNAVSSWRSVAGTASFALDPDGGACPSVVAGGGVSCTVTGVHASFAITSATLDGGQETGARTASLADVDVPGILLKFVVP